MAKILLVDDSKTTRTMLRHRLENEGYEVIESHNGLSGYDAYFEKNPDIVLMDITMPVLDGITALKMIKERDPNAKVIILSSNARRGKISQALEYGAYSYILKPIIDDEYKRVIKEALAQPSE